MVHFNVRPSETVVRSLLQVERMELVRLGRGPRHQTVEHCWISFDARTANTESKSYVESQKFVLSDQARVIKLLNPYAWTVTIINWT